MLASLLDLNPMHAVLHGAAALAYTAAVVCFVSAIVAFAMRKPFVGISLLLGTGLAALTGADLNSIQTLIPPSVTGIVVLTTLLLACQAAWRKSQWSRKTLKIVTYVLAATVVGAFTTALNQKQHFVPFNGAALDGYIWGAIFVLTCLVTIFGLIDGTLTILRKRKDKKNDTSPLPLSKATAEKLRVVRNDDPELRKQA